MGGNNTNKIKAVNSIKVGDVDIPYQVHINKKLKNIRISIDLEGVKVHTPSNIGNYEMERLLYKKGDWIIKHYLRIRAIKSQKQERDWNNAERLLYRGEYKDIIIYVIKGSGVEVSFDGEIFTVHVSEELNRAQKDKMISEAIIKLYKNIAENTLNERLRHFGDIIGVSYNSVRIKDQKTRWGSCSKKGNLNFNWRIIMAPPEVMDYVIIHELCHLKHMDHSRQFWESVEQYMPDYKKARVWLKENGISLNL